MNGDKPHGDGLGERAMEPAREGEQLGGTGGGAGGGSMAGSGDPQGSGAGAGITNPLSMPGVAGEDSEVVAEAAALGSSDGSLADAAGLTSMDGTTMGEAIGSGAGRDVEGGTPGGRGETGGGDPNR